MSFRTAHIRSHARACARIRPRQTPTPDLMRAMQCGQESLEEGCWQAAPHSLYSHLGVDRRDNQPAGVLPARPNHPPGNGSFARHGAA